jgi:hypothetical protein
MSINIDELLEKRTLIFDANEVNYFTAERFVRDNNLKAFIVSNMYENTTSLFMDKKDFKKAFRKRIRTSMRKDFRVFWLCLKRYIKHEIETLFV